jgi:hypothetical protein
MQKIVLRASDPILPIGVLSCVGTTSPRTKIQFTTRDDGIRPVDAIGRPIGDVCADHAEWLGEDNAGHELDAAMQDGVSKVFAENAFIGSL